MAPDGQLEFVVADTGIGIPEDKQHLLFESFSQINTSFQRDYGGTGLGLAISKKLADLIEGDISVQSREGEGSQFTLTLPLKVPAGSQQDSTAQPKSSGEGEPFCRILLVEDDPMIRELLLMALGRRSWHVEIAKSGEEALEILNQSLFDVILMDLQMPGMDGLEATRRIRARESEDGKCLFIIGVTAHARRKVIEECLQDGMDEVITKPIQFKELEETILKHIMKENG